MEEDNDVKTVGQTALTGARILREQLRAIGQQIMGMKNLLTLSNNDGSVLDKGEAIANTVIAFRKCEDSIMRLGKVCEAIEGHRDPVNAPLDGSGQ